MFHLCEEDWFLLSRLPRIQTLLLQLAVVCGLLLLVPSAVFFFFPPLVCLFIAELWDCDWSWKRPFPWAWKVTDPNQQGLLSVLLESLHEWVESSFLSSLVRIFSLSLSFIFVSSIDNLCFYVRCESCAVLKIQRRHPVFEIGTLLQSGHLSLLPLKF